MHRQHDAGEDLRHQEEAEDAAERIPDVEIARRRIGQHMLLREADDRRRLSSQRSNPFFGW